MAGGKGTRMKAQGEKPLIEVCGIPVIVYVLKALSGAKKIDDVVVAVSAATPKTAEYIRYFPVKVVETPGKDYVSDMGYASQTLKLGVFLAIASDLPLVTSDAIDNVIERYQRSGKPALTVAVPIELKRQLGMCVEYSFQEQGRDVVPVGINVIDGSKRYGDEWLDQDIYLLDLPELAVNINTVDELHLAERLLAKKQ